MAVYIIMGGPFGLKEWEMASSKFVSTGVQGLCASGYSYVEPSDSNNYYLSHFALLSP